MAIKSGPNWANAGQIKHMINEFGTARKRFSTSGGKINVICVNGCCYERTSENYEYKAKGNYFKLSGQRFWELISGHPKLYTDLIVPLGHEAQERNDEFNVMFANITNKFTLEFMNDFCNEDGSINWEKLVEFNSKFVPKKTKRVIKPKSNVG